MLCKDSLLSNKPRFNVKQGTYTQQQQYRSKYRQDQTITRYISKVTCFAHLWWYCSQALPCNTPLVPLPFSPTREPCQSSQHKERGEKLGNNLSSLQQLLSPVTCQICNGELLGSQGTNTLISGKSDKRISLLHQLCSAILLKEIEKWEMEKKKNHLSSPVLPSWPEHWSQILLIAVQVTWQILLAWCCDSYMPVPWLMYFPAHSWYIKEFLLGFTVFLPA